MKANLLDMTDQRVQRDLALLQQSPLLRAGLGALAAAPRAAALEFIRVGNNQLKDSDTAFDSYPRLTGDEWVDPRSLGGEAYPDHSVADNSGND